MLRTRAGRRRALRPRLAWLAENRELLQALRARWRQAFSGGQRNAGPVSPLAPPPPLPPGTPGPRGPAAASPKPKGGQAEFESAPARRYPSLASETREGASVPLVTAAAGGQRAKTCLTWALQCLRMTERRNNDSLSGNWDGAQQRATRGNLHANAPPWRRANLWSESLTSKR